MTYFLKSGSRFNVSTKSAMDLHESLPVDTYTVKFDKIASCFYLEAIENFEVPGKIYGDTVRNAGRILNTFNDRTSSTGVLLTGEKGSGKTLLAKLLAVRAAAAGMPTIVINEPWCGEDFNAFIQMIEQPTVILFDEFEKVYDEDAQEKMLTLLDGVYPSKKLFVLTCNDKWRIDSHMRNRPGRIFYSLDFGGVEQDFIIEYCNDNLRNIAQTDSVCRVAAMFNQFNFDMLQALIEEMNRYDEPASEAVRMLNTKPEFAGDSKFAVSLQIDGIDIATNLLEPEYWYGNPLTTRIDIEYKVNEADKGESDDTAEPALAGQLSLGCSTSKWKSARFTQTDLKQIDPQSGRFVFVNNNGNRVLLIKVKEKEVNYFGAF